MWKGFPTLIFLVNQIPIVTPIAYELPESVLNNIISYPGVSYYYSNSQARFQEASYFCSKIIGGVSNPLNHLAVITTDEELSRLQDVFKGMHQHSRLRLI